MAIKTVDVATIRKDFPIFETGIAYLDSANTSQTPRQGTRAMQDYFGQYNANILRSAYGISQTATERCEGAREKVKRFVNARSAKEIVFTSGTTESINLVAYSWGRANVRAGDLIVCTAMEHHPNLLPWQ